MTSEVFCLRICPHPIPLSKEQGIYTTPYETIAFATFKKPAMFAPIT